MQMRGALLLLPVAALLLTPTPSAATPALSAPGTAPLLALVSLAVWACCGWLLLVAMLTLGAARTGRLAAPARGLLRRLAPPAVRSAARLALGVTLTVTALGSSPASAASSVSGGGPVGRVPVSTSSLDWPRPPSLARRRPPPSLARRRPPPSLDWPTATAGLPFTSSRFASTPPATVPPAAVPAAPAVVAEPTVVVKPGDCLWDLAARSLGSAATPARTATAWPAWWSANRTVIGEDPDLIHPGTRLVPPTRAT